jgi:endoglucanase
MMRISRTGTTDRIVPLALGLAPLVLGLGLCWFGASANAEILYRGINLTGGEFARKKIPGQYAKDYIYPGAKDVDYFLDKGMNVFRLPFLWERLQPVAAEPLDEAELARLDQAVEYITGKGATVIIDLHNYARYHGKVVGVEISDDALADIWRRLAEHYRDNRRVAFGLMNEPHGLPTETWVASANKTIAAIRATGSAHLLLVPGNAWTGAHSWNKTGYGTANAVAMRTIVDEQNNYLVEAHQYLDKDSSGTHPHCVDVGKAMQRLVDFTDWLRETGNRGFLGEFAGGRSPECIAALDAMLTYVAENEDVWAGWTYWAGGPWWGNYMFNLSPTKNNEDRPQLAPIMKHL